MNHNPQKPKSRIPRGGSKSKNNHSSLPINNPNNNNQVSNPNSNILNFFSGHSNSNFNFNNNNRPYDYSYEYTNPKHKTETITLTGNLSQHPKPKASREVQQFSNISKFNLPDSKRTLIPQFQPISEKEKMLHKANSFYSNKLKGNTTGPDFISYNGEKKYVPRKGAGKIMQESTQMKKPRELRGNNLFQKYVQYSQINNIPGPDIGKRLEDEELKEYEIVGNNDNNDINNEYSNQKNMKKKRGGNCSVISGLSKNTEIESFQRKVFRDYNSNIACLPGGTINAKDKTKTLVHTNSRKNESQIIFGENNYSNNRNNNNNLNNDWNKNYSSNNTKRRVIDEENMFTTRKKRYVDNANYNEVKKDNRYPRPVSFSGKKILRNRNLDNFHVGLAGDENMNKNVVNKNINNNNVINKNGKVNYYDFAPINDKQKYYLMKNRSQITFG